MVRPRTELLFRIAMAVKGIDGLIELIGGITLLLVSQAEVQKVIAAVVTRDLLGPPDGSLARHFVAGTAEFASGDRTFAVLYLLLHGVLKVALVIALLSLSWTNALYAALAAGVSGLGMARLAMRQIGGQTGDVLGGTEQVSETAILVLLAARLAQP